MSNVAAEPAQCAATQRARYTQPTTAIETSNSGQFMQLLALLVDELPLSSRTSPHSTRHTNSCLSHNSMSVKPFSLFDWPTPHLQLLPLLLPLLPVPCCALVLHAHPQLVHLYEVGQQEVNSVVDVTTLAVIRRACATVVVHKHIRTVFTHDLAQIHVISTSEVCLCRHPAGLGTRQVVVHTGGEQAVCLCVHVGPQPGIT